ncbi:MAG: hypothetical protein AAGA62_18885, partial [Bacteroidota bacterium]
FQEAGVDSHQDFYLSYHFIQPFDSINHRHFAITTQVRIEDLDQKVCPFVQVRVIDETDVSFVTLVQKGCEANASLKLNETFLSGQNNDLSALGLDLEDWQNLRIVTLDGMAEIYINDEITLSLPTKRDRGRIMGLIIISNTLSSLDFVQLKDLNNGATFREDFDR